MNSMYIHVYKAHSWGEKMYFLAHLGFEDELESRNEVAAEEIGMFYNYTAALD